MPKTVPQTAPHARGNCATEREGQHYRVAGLNLLAAIILYWNTLKLGDAVFATGQAKLELLRHSYCGSLRTGSLARFAGKSGV